MPASRLSLATLVATSTLLVLHPRLLSADVISGSVSCSSPSGDYYNLTQVQQTSSRGCSVQTAITDIPTTTTLWSSTELARASVSGNYLLSSNEVSGDLNGSTYAYPHSTASAQITFSETFTTDGPERTGLVRGYFYPDTFRYGGNISASIVSPMLRYATFTEAAPNITFELGQQFTLTILGTATTISDDGTPSFSQFDIPFHLAFFEADGVTPVALRVLTGSPDVAQAPEPAGVALSLIGFAGAIAFRTRRKFTVR